MKFYNDLIYEFNTNNISRTVSFNQFGNFILVDNIPKEGWYERYINISSNPPEYKLLTCNCEHVARFINSNKSYSTQLLTYKLKKKIN